MNELNASLEQLAPLVTQPRIAVLVALLIAAAIIDWRTYRIPNWLTFSGMAFGLVHGAATAASTMDGLLASLAGFGVGLGVLLPLYLLRVLGAGDVKLMAMVGAILGMPAVFGALLSSLIVGGVAALAFAIYRRTLRRMAGNVMDIVQSVALAAATGLRPVSPMAAGASVGRFPNGVCIAIGTIVSMAAGQLVQA